MLFILLRVAELLSATSLSLRMSFLSNLLVSDIEAIVLRHWSLLLSFLKIYFYCTLMGADMEVTFITSLLNVVIYFYFFITLICFHWNTLIACFPVRFLFPTTPSYPSLILLNWYSFLLGLLLLHACIHTNVYAYVCMSIWKYICKYNMQDPLLLLVHVSFQGWPHSALQK